MTPEERVKYLEEHKRALEAQIDNLRTMIAQLQILKAGCAASLDLFEKCYDERPGEHLTWADVALLMGPVDKALYELTKEENEHQTKP